MHTTDSHQPAPGTGETAPRVSIGLPVYNGDAFLEQSIDSLLGQTYTDIELIIADNASTDRTEAICRERAARDSRVRYQRHSENMGPVYNFNCVVAMARGEYFKWAAHDDMHDATHVARCVEILDAHPEVVLVHSRTQDVDADGNVLARKNFGLDVNVASAPERFRELVRQDYTIEALFGLLRIDVLRRTRLLSNYADCDRVLLAEVGLAGRIQEIPEYLFIHRQHDNRSVARYRSRQTRSAWFDPSKEGKPVFPYTREFLGFLTAIGRSTLSLGEKVQCQAHMLKWAVHNAANLTEDLTFALRHVLRPLKHRLVGPPKRNGGGE